MPPSPRWTRRQLLVSAGTGVAAVLASPLLSACTADGPGPHRPSAGSPSPTPDPDPPVLRSAAADEQRLVATYQALVQRVPALRAQLQTVIEDHQAHLSALTDGASGTSPTPTGVSPTPEVTALPLPDDPKAAIQQLVVLEQQTAGSRLREVPNVSGQLARTLASIAASEATHAALLPAVATRDLAAASASAAVSSAAAKKKSS